VRRLPRRSAAQAGRTSKTKAPSYDSASQSGDLKPMNFHYVYILQSEKIPERFYVGLTNDLKGRLRKHNAGDVPHTSKLRPWRIKTAIAFTNAEKAQALKTSSGRAFAKKRL
jgi:predicted GIY-YIG superfamily endonuclease